MKMVILAGGEGTRMAEETDVKSKAMVTIGGKPIIWHIMKNACTHDVREFFIALGYRGDTIKRFFLEYHNLANNITIDLATGYVNHHGMEAEPWRVHLIETGRHTMTAGRLGQLKPWLGGNTFMVTYTDGVSDVDFGKLAEFHKSQGKLVTMTAVKIPARFGGIVMEGGLVKAFMEKPDIGEGWINGGFMMMEPEVLDRMNGDALTLEADILPRLVKENQLAAYKHTGFWQCMDNTREMGVLNDMWNRGAAPWKNWS